MAHARPAALVGIGNLYIVTMLWMSLPDPFDDKAEAYSCGTARVAGWRGRRWPADLLIGNCEVRRSRGTKFLSTSGESASGSLLDLKHGARLFACFCSSFRNLANSQQERVRVIAYFSNKKAISL